MPNTPRAESPVTQAPHPETPDDKLKVAVLIALPASPILIPLRPPSAPPIMGTPGQQTPPLAPPGGGPQQPQGQANAQPAALGPMQVFTQSMALLTQSMMALVTATTTSNTSKAMQKPAPFKGEQGGEVCRFLAAFTMWAMSQGSALNVLDPQGNPTWARDDQWICTMLSYLQDDAAIWATPAMEALTQGNLPYNGNWNKFRTQFKACFEMVDKAVDVKEHLWKLWKGNLTLPEYATHFNGLAGHTGYSSQDLRDQFYEHLSSAIKDELVHTTCPIASLDDLIKVAVEIDVRICQRHAEKAHKHGHTTVFPTPKVSITPHMTSFTPAARDPNAMEIDTTRTCDEFNCLMQGKCYGCGSAAHVKNDEL